MSGNCRPHHGPFPARQTPASLSSLQTRLSSGVSGLLEFCSTVGNLIPSSPAGQKDKDLTLDIAKMIPFEQLLKILSEGVSALYNNHRSDDALDAR